MVGGGAGNAANNVAALGGRVRLAGRVGADAEGRRLLASFLVIPAPQGFLLSWTLLRFFLLPFLSRTRPQDNVAFAADIPAEDLLALHDALEQLAAHDPAKARLVELRFFAGLTLEQAAECLGISLSTADRAWRYARAWLYSAMADDGPEGK